MPNLVPQISINFDNSQFSTHSYWLQPVYVTHIPVCHFQTPINIKIPLNIMPTYTYIKNTLCLLPYGNK